MAGRDLGVLGGLVHVLDERAVIRALLDLCMQPGHERRRAHRSRHLVDRLFHRCGHALG